MSLSQALSIAMLGLRANQLALALTSSNVANSDTPGYVRKTVNQVQTVSRRDRRRRHVTGVNRELDLYLQQQIRTEQSRVVRDLPLLILSSLQSIYGPRRHRNAGNPFNSLVTAVRAIDQLRQPSARIACSMPRSR